MNRRVLLLGAFLIAWIGVLRVIGPLELSLYRSVWDNVPSWLAGPAVLLLGLGVKLLAVPLLALYYASWNRSLARQVRELPPPRLDQCVTFEGPRLPIAAFGVFMLVLCAFGAWFVNVTSGAFEPDAGSLLLVALWSGLAAAAAVAASRTWRALTDADRAPRLSIAPDAIEEQSLPGRHVRIARRDIARVARTPRPGSWFSAVLPVRYVLFDADGRKLRVILPDGYPRTAQLIRHLDAWIADIPDDARVAHATGTTALSPAPR